MGSLKVEAGVPKVSLPKLNCENVNGGQPKSASSTTILSEPAIPSSSSSSLMTERRDQTAKRSGPKITARARTAATPPSTHKLISNVSENCNIIVPCSGGMDTNQNEPDELDPLVKVEIEMEAPGVEDSIPVDYNTTYNTDLLDTSHYVYPNNSLRNISEMDVSSSSVNHNHIFSVSSNADYAASTSTSIFSSVINQSEKNYKCKTCGSCFDSIRGLNGHMAAHSIRSISTASPSVYRRNKSSFTCKTCGKFFNNTSTLNQHIIQAHSANLPYFKKTNSKIRKHIPCPICGKLVRSDCLPRHSLIHSGETPYSCRYCNRKFRDTTQQLHHEKSQHTMEVFFKDLPHGTTLADIDGIINDILAQMKKISDSSADKRYQCPYCPRKLLEGQKSCSRTHFLHKHFDKVQSLVKSRYGTNFPVDQHSMLMENVTFASDIQHNDEIQNQHFLDPLVTYSH
ncbi:putative zinc finger protein [Orchesella cincta]|uniref:Putative zinc finger protein n=1 Tax=Orchesella cincta TaxID=48709 RepID=A0A1D2NGX7_ORCCI|nr:putative zinc finger protein [Orchesella cincta]